MDDFVYEQLPQRIVFGWGRIEDLPAEVERCGGRRVMVISENSTAPVAAEISERLGPRVVASIIGVAPHVQKEEVDRARREASASHVDLVITVGGGSATGVGKNVVIENAIPLVAVPTTYSGSEVTPIYGMTEARKKTTGRDPRSVPRTVVYDPALTVSLPARLTASTGLNAVAHCVEALYAESPTPVASVLAEEGIRVLADALPRCVADPADKEGRAGALYGAYLAGTVLATSGMAVHHRICHVLGGTFALAHGDANAVVLPHAVAYNEPAAPEAIRRVADALGTDDAAGTLFDLAASMGAPTSLRELGMEEAGLAEAASLIAAGDFYNPRPAGRDDLRALLEAAFEGRRPHSGDKENT